MRDVVISLVVIGVFLLGAFASSVYSSLFIDYRDPISGEIFTEAVNTPIRTGEDLIVKVTRTKVRDDCPVTSVRRLEDINGKKWTLDRATITGGSSELGSILVVYPVGKLDLPPGKYVLRVALAYRCPSINDPFEHTQEPVRFQVVK